MPAYDVCALGCVAWDMLATVAHYPQADEKTGLSAMAQMGGGLSGTAMSAVAALGGRSAIFGLVGDDDFGKKIVAGFHHEGVATHGLTVRPGHTSHFAFCVAEEGTGNRAIFFMPGSYGRLEAGAVDLAALTDCRCLLVDHHHLYAAIEAGQYARSVGVPVVGDIERRHDGAKEFVQAVDYPIVPERFVGEFTGREDVAGGARDLLELGAKAVVVTQGARGATAFTPGETLHQPAFPVQPIVDTTGAGDVFHGAFAYGVARGYDLRRNLAFASAAAALSCRALGGRGALPTMAEVEALLAG